MTTMLIHLPGAGALTRAICMTLVHSLWQGLLASVLAGFFIAATRRSRAAVRYNLLTFVVLLFLLAVGVTFFRELGVGHILPASYVTGKSHGVTVVGALTDLTIANAPVRGIHPTVLLRSAARFLNAHASAVVLVWMLCLLWQLLRMGGGLYQMGKLRSSRIFLPSEEWCQRLAVLAAQLGVTKEVTLLQSALVKMPVTFGFLKPSILVPLGMLANLPPDQVETVLLHELAHIRRNDYVMNLGLHFLEAVFFFNPGIRWIASRLREEREACCDDMVIDGAGDRNSYLDALVSFGEIAAARGQGYALSLGTGKTDLLWRIRRMLNQENKKLHIMEKAILSIGLSVILTIGLISMRNGAWQPHKTGRTAMASFVDQPATDTDTLPGMSNIQKSKFPTINTSIDDNGTTRKTRINATDAEGNTFELTKVNDEVTSLVINGKAIPKESFDRYMYIFEEIARRSTRGEDRERQELWEREHDEYMARAERQQEEAQAKLERDQEEVQAKVERDQEEMQAKAERQQEEAQEKAERALEEAQAKMEKDQVKAAAAFEEAQKEIELKQQEASEKHSSADRYARHIIHDLVDKGVLGENQANLAFKLDSKELVVNGTKQSDELFQFFKDKYIKSPKDHFIYSHNTNSTTYDVWVDSEKHDDQE